ncbi:MAG TPA: hypothetical protein VGJ26_21510 [Pirellulales bacterium]
MNLDAGGSLNSSIALNHSMDADMAIDRFLKRNRIENAKYVIEKLRALGLGQYSDPSRWMKMLRVLERGPIEYGHKDFYIALEAERDFQYMGFVFEHLDSEPGDSEFSQRIRKILKDPIYPQQNLELSPGRDTQLELFLAAICRRAELGPVVFKEPDLTCCLWNSNYGIAAKRIKNISAIRKHAKRAADQIARSGLPGIIFLDLSLALNRENRPALLPCCNNRYRDEAMFSLRQVVGRHESDIRRWVEGSGVLAIVAYKADLRHHSDREWGLVGFSCWLQTTWNLESSCLWEQFAGPFLRGFPNQEFLTN